MSMFACRLACMLVSVCLSAVDCSMDVGDVQLAAILGSVRAFVSERLPQAEAEEKHQASK